MISHGKDIKVFCGNANQPLAAEICQMMGTCLLYTSDAADD